MSPVTGPARRGGQRARVAGAGERRRRGDGEQLRLGQPLPAGLISERVSRTGAEVEAARAGGAVTLDDLLVGTWEGLTAGRTATCPVCRGAMAPEHGSAQAPAVGRCADCGTTLG